MKILHLVPSYKPAYIYGGPIVSVSQLCESQAALGHEVQVYTTTANGVEELEVQPNIPIKVEEVTVIYFKRITGDHTHLSPKLWWQLWQRCKNFEVIHIHSWWSPLVLIATLICIIKGVKPIITPRGMLGAYTLQPALKRGIHFFIGKYLLSRCTLHATTQMEWEECQQLIPHWQGFTLPNIIKLPITLPNRKPTEQFTIAYLSRIDPKKGLELSLQALAKVNFPFKLKIAGKGDLGYIEELKKLIENLGLKHAIEWVGWKAGDEKYDFLAAADIFLLTSYNENFANVVIESLSVGTPVLVSNKVGIYDFVQQENLGWVSKLTIDSICTQLENAFKEKNKREKIFNNAPATVKKAFASDYLAKQYINAYQKYGC